MFSEHLDQENRIIDRAISSIIGGSSPESVQGYVKDDITYKHYLVRRVQELLRTQGENEAANGASFRIHNLVSCNTRSIRTILG